MSCVPSSYRLQMPFTFVLGFERTKAADVILCSPSRYFYRACQGTLFPSPVQVGRQLDTLPAEICRNILSLSRVKVGSPLSPRPPFLCLNKPLPKSCNKESEGGFQGPNSTQGPIFKTEDAGNSHKTDNEVSKDLYTLVNTYGDTLPYTKDLPVGQQNPPTQNSECLDKTLEATPGTTSSWVTSTPLLIQADSVELPSEHGPHCVRYTRNSEEGLQSEHRTEQKLHVAL